MCTYKNLWIFDPFGQDTKDDGFSLRQSHFERWSTKHETCHLVPGIFDIPAFARFLSLQVEPFSEQDETQAGNHQYFRPFKFYCNVAKEWVQNPMHHLENVWSYRPWVLHGTFLIAIEPRFPIPLSYMEIARNISYNFPWYCEKKNCLIFQYEIHLVYSVSIGNV